MENKKLVVLLDSVCRTIAGVGYCETDSTITIENPVIVNAMPNQSGQMSLQLIPVFFREILEDKNQDFRFTYNKDNITMSDITNLDPNIISQYTMLFQPVPEPVDTGVVSKDNVVDLFEEEKKDA